MDVFKAEMRFDQLAARVDRMTDDAWCDRGVISQNSTLHMTRDHAARM